MDPIVGFSGLASGIQWRDLVDQIMALETQRRLDPVTTRKSLEQKRYDAWGTWQSLVTKFRDASKALRDSTAFLQFKASGGTSASTGRTLLTATASSSASPGTFGVEVLDLARATKLSGSVNSSATTALGLAGEFAVNGRRIGVVATDTLANIRDKINAVNTGTNASGVTASVLSTGASQHRLVLTADGTGASGIELVDDGAGTLQSLGVVDANKTLNLGASGAAQTYRVSAATAAIATMLGVNLPPPSTINIGGRVITVDLTVDSLTSIATKILAAGGNAAVESETVNGKTFYRLVTSDTVTASTADGQRTLEVLGFMENGRSGVAQVLKSDNTYTDGTGAQATASTLLTDLKVNGNALGIAAGDTFTLQGMRGDGSIVNVSFVVGASDTLQTVLDELNDATTGYGAGSRTATASLSAGRIVLTDNATGDSQLALSMSVTSAGGSTINLGRVSTDTVGRLREVVAGSDSRVKVDGVVLRRGSNTISDALAGVTLNLQNAEVGTTTTLTVERDVDAIVKSMNDLANSYNELVKFRDDQAKVGAPLHNNSTLRANLGSITNVLLSNVTGTTGTYTSATMAGLSLQSDGKLALDATVFKAALAANFADVTRLFSTSGSATNSSVSYYLSTTKSVPGTYAVDITAVATVPSVTGSGFSGTYSDDGTADTMTITDASTGYGGNISLANGDSKTVIVNKLNALFAANKMNLTASESGNEIVLTGTQYGTAATFTVAYTAGGTDNTAQLGIAAGTYAGTNVAGTIGGVAATGSGQVLTGVVGGATEGLAIRYTGSSTGAQGTITFVLGVSGGLFNAAEAIAGLTGTVSTQQEALQRQINDLQVRADTVQQALDRKRQSLMQEFVEMERAMSRIQQQSASLAGFISSISAQQK